MEKLIILSDLWGAKRSDWVLPFINQLASSYDVHFYDSCALGGVDATDYQKEVLYQQFIRGGIARAVEQLLQQEPDPVHILACSIGGAIAWKAVLRGLPMKQFVAISATRLRYETTRPTGKIHLYYGDQDLYRPGTQWFEEMKVEATILPDGEHDLYREPGLVPKLIAPFI